MEGRRVAFLGQKQGKHAFVGWTQEEPAMPFSPTLCSCVDKNHHLLCGKSHIWGVSMYTSVEQCLWSEYGVQHLPLHSRPGD